MVNNKMDLLDASPAYAVNTFFGFISKKQTSPIGGKTNAYTIFVPIRTKKDQGMADNGIKMLVIQGIAVLYQASATTNKITLAEVQQTTQGFFIAYTCDTDYSGYLCQVNMELNSQPYS